MTLPLLSPSWNPETLNKHGGDDGNGQDATYKVHSRSAKKLEFISIIPGCSACQMKRGDFLGVESLSTKSKPFRMRKTSQFLVVCSRPPQNVFWGSLTSWPSSDGKEMYLKVWCTSTVFWCSYCCRPHSFVAYNPWRGGKNGNYSLQTKRNLGTWGTERK